MIMRRNATLKEVAKACGVTAQTASRILNSPLSNLYRKETVELVTKKAEELGYRLNTFAQSVRNGKFHCISMLVSPEIEFSSFPLEFLIGIQTQLVKSGYNLMFNVLPKNASVAEKELPRIFRENLVDGAIVAITHAIPEWLESLIKSINVPIVWIGSKHESDCVNHNDFGAAYQITKRFINDGHQKICYADFAIPENLKEQIHFSVYERMKGYSKAIEEAGLEKYIARPSHMLNKMETVSFAEQKIVREIKPSAVLCYDLPFCGRPIIYAFCRNGISVPNDVSLAVFTNENVPENGLDIARFSPNSSEIIKTATTFLLKKISDPETTNAPAVIPFSFYEGNSLAKAKVAKNQTYIEPAEKRF